MDIDKDKEKLKWEFYGKDKIIIGATIFTLEELQNRVEDNFKNYRNEIEDVMKIKKEVLKELETYKNEIKKYKHSMAMISEICIDESKVHITTREAIEEIRKYIYHGVDIDWARKEVENDR